MVAFSCKVEIVMGRELLETMSNVIEARQFGKVWNLTKKELITR